MKRKSVTVEVEAPLDSIREVLSDPPQFIMNWPYVVKINTKNGISAEIRLPRFFLKLGDVYTFTSHGDSSSFIYDGTGRRSNLIVTVTLKGWRKSVTADVEVAYNGRGEHFLGKTLERFAEGIGKTLKGLAESYSPPKPVKSSGEVILQVDFSDPVSVANFLAKAKMVHSGLHMIEGGKFFDVLMELRKTANNDVLYVSGVTSDGARSFKALLQGSRILAIEYREGADGQVVKVEDEETAAEALRLASSIEGVYMINVWVPVGGV